MKGRAYLQNPCFFLSLSPINHFWKLRDNAEIAQKLEEINNNNGSVCIATNCLFLWQQAGILSLRYLSTSCVSWPAENNPGF